MGNKLVYGVGINNADYQVRPMVGGKQRKMCPYYKVWSSMLYRAYSHNFKKRRPTYQNCTVCEGWLSFMSFRDWMEQQDWVGKQLDKDLLVEGNKVYSPDTCAFVSPISNTFIEKAATKGLIGASLTSNGKKYRASCSNPFTKKRESLGVYNTELEAHLAWKARKHQLACLLAQQETDERVANILKKKFN